MSYRCNVTPFSYALHSNKVRQTCLELLPNALMPEAFSPDETATSDSGGTISSTMVSTLCFTLIIQYGFTESEAVSVRRGGHFSVFVYPDHHGAGAIVDALPLALSCIGRRGFEGGAGERQREHESRNSPRPPNLRAHHCHPSYRPPETQRICSYSPATRVTASE